MHHPLSNSTTTLNPVPSQAPLSFAINVMPHNTSPMTASQDHSDEPELLARKVAANGNGVASTTPSWAPTINGLSHEIDYARPMKVIVIGAGISGILASIRFPRRIRNLDLVVYDKNPEVGGTWYENRYPGIACGMYILIVRLRLDILINNAQISLPMCIRPPLSPTQIGRNSTPLVAKSSSTGKASWQSTTRGST